MTLSGWLGILLVILMIGLGVLAGRNLDRLAALLGSVNGVLAVVAVAAAAGVGTWWWRTRNPKP